VALLSIQYTEESNLDAGLITSMVDLAGLLVIMLGLYLLIKGAFLFSAYRKKDIYFLREYASKKRHPFFFVVFGVALMVSGWIVVFVPFTTSVSN
jgi:uncharacterized membrane protein HdeD (DUF308 family)